MRPPPTSGGNCSCGPTHGAQGCSGSVRGAGHDGLPPQPRAPQARRLQGGVAGAVDRRRVPQAAHHTHAAADDRLPSRVLVRRGGVARAADHFAGE